MGENLNNLEGTYRKWLWVRYKFHPEIEEQENREIAFKNLMNQIAIYCRHFGYNAELFNQAREIKNNVYPFGVNGLYLTTYQTEL